MAEKDPAEQLADYLLTNGYGLKADRLLLVTEVAGTQDLGGWSRAAVVGAIRKFFPAPQRNEAVIKFFGQPAKVCCDRLCSKAWGGSQRPKVQLSDDPDDYAYLADDELGEAPVDPGTYEGDVPKPESPDEFPTKWCVRECERSAMSKPGEWMLPLEVLDFSLRRCNKPMEQR